MVLLTEVIRKIDTFLVLNLMTISTSLFLIVDVMIFFFLLVFVESKKRIGIDFAALFLEVVGYVKMSFQLVLSFKSDITFFFALLVRTNEMRQGEVLFEIGVFIIVDVFVVMTAQVARQVLAMQVVEELPVVEEKLLAEVAKRMRQNLAVPLITNVAFFQVHS